MLKKPKAINGTLVLVRVKAYPDKRMGGNMYCKDCIYYFDGRCKLSHTNSSYNYDLELRAYQFCIKVTPAPGISGWNRKFVYIYVEEKEIL